MLKTQASQEKWEESVPAGLYHAVWYAVCCRSLVNPNDANCAVINTECLMQGRWSLILGNHWGFFSPQRWAKQRVTGLMFFCEVPLSACSVTGVFSLVARWAFIKIKRKPERSLWNMKVLKDLFSHPLKNLQIKPWGFILIFYFFSQMVRLKIGMSIAW